MAEATQITIATGTTAYGSDPQSDERISTREVRVEITYQLAPGEDAVLTASRKAAEAEHARRAAWERIQTGLNDEDFDPADLGLEPPDDLVAAPDSFPEDADYIIPVTTPPAWNGESAPTPTAPDQIEWATKPQQLSIRSHFRRLELSPENQTALLRERFGKFRVERLTKTEAVQLMRSLERDECLLTSAC